MDTDLRNIIYFIFIYFLLFIKIKLTWNKNPKIIKEILELHVNLKNKEYLIERVCLLFCCISIISSEILLFFFLHKIGLESSNQVTSEFVNKCVFYMKNIILFININFSLTLLYNNIKLRGLFRLETVVNIINLLFLLYILCLTLNILPHKFLITALFITNYLYELLGPNIYNLIKFLFFKCKVRDGSGNGICKVADGDININSNGKRSREIELNTKEYSNKRRRLGSPPAYDYEDNKRNRHRRVNADSNVNRKYSSVSEYNRNFSSKEISKEVMNTFKNSSNTFNNGFRGLSQYRESSRSLANMPLHIRWETDPDKMKLLLTKHSFLDVLWGRKDHHFNHLEILNYWGTQDYNKLLSDLAQMHIELNEYPNAFTTRQLTRHISYPHYNLLKKDFEVKSSDTLLRWADDFVSNWLIAGSTGYAGKFNTDNHNIEYNSLMHILANNNKPYTMEGLAKDMQMVIENNRIVKQWMVKYVLSLMNAGIITAEDKSEWHKKIDLIYFKTNEHTIRRGHLFKTVFIDKNFRPINYFAKNQGIHDSPTLLALRQKGRMFRPLRSDMDGPLYFYTR